MNVSDSAMDPWARELVHHYQSHAASQFILHGNVHDRWLLPLSGGGRLGRLTEYLEAVLLGPFDVVLSLDSGHGLRIEKGRETFHQWPSAKGDKALPRAPREAIDLLSHYLRYLANQHQLSGRSPAVAVILREAQLLLPNVPGVLNHELNAMALLVRDWADMALSSELRLASFLLTDNANNLHPLVARHPRALALELPLPDAASMARVLRHLQTAYPVALEAWSGDVEPAARQLAGATISSVESLLRRRQQAGEPLQPADLAALKKALVERDSRELIEFVQPDRTMDDLEGLDQVRAWLRQDLELWRQGELQAMPMGYLICGPVGTGKTFLVECMAGEAGVPVVKLANFRDRWVGSTESNLETIFRLLDALGRCIVFVDEADQSLGARQSGGDSGVSGRVYSMIAQQMSNTRHRGRILWVLASSRPDLIEVDLKRPGRIDVKLPLFPCVSEADGYRLLRALAGRRGLALPESMPVELAGRIPDLLTPGAAEALAVKAYRHGRVGGLDALPALLEALRDHQPPVAEEVLQFQIALAVREATDLSFVPHRFRNLPATAE